MMIIREYVHSDEQGWVRCRVLSFLDTSYSGDVKTEKETYLQPALCLVAEDNGQVVGLIDAELDSYDLACADGDRGAVLWSLAVLPEYRRRGIAAALWCEMKKRLVAEGIRYCEVWTQEDEPANSFYLSQGFTQETAQTWLRCRANAAGVEKLISADAMDGIFGIDELVFNAPVMRRNELLPLCERIDEVRLYTIAFKEE